MALPKEPRQKMINFMYLVLTAMLALNVSSEILNAFKVVDGSLIKSNGVVDQSNKNIQSSLTELMKSQDNAAKAAIWQPKANAALSLTEQESQYIEKLKTDLKREAGYNPEKGDTTFKDDDLDAATRLFDTKGEGEKLKSSLEKFRSDIIAQLGDPKLQKEVEANIPIDTNVPKSESGNSNNSWTTSYFHMTPTVAALTMLSKFQNDVKRTGNIIAEKCLEQVGRVEFHLDKFVAFAGQNSEYLLPGQPIVITAGLGAFSSDPKYKPTVTINGANTAVDANGVATYNGVAESGGDHVVNVDISFTNPNTGKVEHSPKTIKYTVGQPSGASIFLSKMNVMYIGVDNPITVSGGSGKAESMQVSFTGGSISGSGASRICRPTTAGNATVNVTIEGKTTPFPIRVKYLPDPIPMVGSAKHGPMPAASFRAMGGVRCELENSDFDAKFSVTSYKVGGYVNGQYQETAVSGQQWGGNAIISAAKPGSVVFLFQIHAKGEDGKDRTLNDLTFKLQ